MNVKLVIDPFSRLLPMKLETELDTLVENFVFGSGRTQEVSDPKDGDGMIVRKELSVEEAQTPYVPGPNPDLPTRAERSGSFSHSMVGRYGKGTERADLKLEDLPSHPTFKDDPDLPPIPPQGTTTIVQPCNI
jgi:hypothetical protein